MPRGTSNGFLPADPVDDGLDDALAPYSHPVSRKVPLEFEISQPRLQGPGQHYMSKSLNGFGGKHLGTSAGGAAQSGYENDVATYDRGSIAPGERRRLVLAPQPALAGGDVPRFGLISDEVVDSDGLECVGLSANQGAQTFQDHLTERPSVSMDRRSSSLPNFPVSTAGSPTRKGAHDPSLKQQGERRTTISESLRRSSVIRSAGRSMSTNLDPQRHLIVQGNSSMRVVSSIPE